MRRLAKYSLVMAGMLWLGAVAGGMRALVRYEGTPGTEGAVPVPWPAGTTLERATDRDTLVMFVHPRCPCSKASIEELDALMARCGRQVRAYVAASRPGGVGGAEWEHGTLVAAAGRIPGVTVVADQGGAEARRFGAETSGEVVLYDPRGRLLYHGGITDGRGHAGDNPQLETMVALLSGREHADQVRRGAVFGCSILGQDQPAGAK